MKCNFEDICLFLDKKLPLLRQLEVLEHLKNCDICYETARLLKRDRYAGIYAMLNGEGKLVIGRSNKRSHRTYRKTEHDGNRT